MTRGRHLSDDRLVEFHLQCRGCDTEGPVQGAVVRAHLDTCELCARRYAEMAGFLDAVRGETEAADAAVFTDTRLAAQHDRIMRRVRHIGHPGHVLSFPASRIAHRVRAAAGATTRRWVAAAAVAGLVVGLAIGRFVDRQAVNAGPRPATTIASTSLPTRHVAPTALAARHQASSNDAFVSLDLSELDSSFESEHPIVLQAYDALTPSVQEVSSTR